jgi:Na+/H+-dicarboxylate symporter
MLTMVLTQVGLPIEGIALILGVDRLMDMIRTAVNITGDAVVSVVVARGENKIDLRVYDDPNAGQVEDERLVFDPDAEAKLAAHARPHLAE